MINCFVKMNEGRENNKILKKNIKIKIYIFLNE